MQQTNNTTTAVKVAMLVERNGVYTAAGQCEGIQYTTWAEMDQKKEGEKCMDKRHNTK